MHHFNERFSFHASPFYCHHNPRFQHSTLFRGTLPHFGHGRGILAQTIDRRTGSSLVHNIHPQIALPLQYKRLAAITPPLQRHRRHQCHRRRCRWHTPLNRMPHAAQKIHQHHPLLVFFRQRQRIRSQQPTYRVQGPTNRVHVLCVGNESTQCHVHFLSFVIHGTIKPHCYSILTHRFVHGTIPHVNIHEQWVSTDVIQQTTRRCLVVVFVVVIVVVVFVLGHHRETVVEQFV